MRRFSYFLILVLLLGTTGSAAQYAAIVNGETISMQEFEQVVDAAKKTLALYDDLDLESEEGQFLIIATQRSILDEMINNTLIKQQAKQMKISVTTADVNEEITRLRQGFPSQKAFEETLAAEYINTEELYAATRTRLVSEKIKKELSNKINISDKELSGFMHSNRDFFIQNEHRKYAQILVATEELAAEILAKLQDNSPAVFADLAREYSLDKQAARYGGDIGFLELGVYDQQIEALLFSLQEGELSRIIELPEGYAIFRCTQVIQTSPGDIDLSSNEVHKYLLRKKENELFERWFAKVRNAAKIEINSKIKIDLPPDSIPEHRQVYPGQSISNERV